MLAASITLPHVSISLLMRSAKCSGVLATGSYPSVTKRCFISEKLTSELPGQSGPAPEHEETLRAINGSEQMPLRHCKRPIHSMAISAGYFRRRQGFLQDSS